MGVNFVKDFSDRDGPIKGGIAKVHVMEKLLNDEKACKTICGNIGGTCEQIGSDEI